VQVHYDEGVAIHIGPEPCVGVRKDADEASVGESIGQPLSRESQSPDADAVSSAEGNTFRTHHRKVRTARRGRRTWHVQKLVPVGNLRSEILVVQSAQNWHRQGATDSLDGTRGRRVLVQR
jgi:hypothetical protein